MPGFTPATEEFKQNKIAASDTVLDEDTTERNTNSVPYDKMVALRVPTGIVAGTTARVVMQIKATSPATAYGRIYKNGVALGTAQSTASTSYVTFSEDLDIGSAGDEIQLYLSTTNGSFATYENLLSIRGDLDEIATDWETVYP